MPLSLDLQMSVDVSTRVAARFVLAFFLFGSRELQCGFGKNTKDINTSYWKKSPAQQQ